MKPVYQTDFSVPGGNCFAACLASLLELDIEAVPNFHKEHKDRWLLALTPWLRPFGLFPITIAAPNEKDAIRHLLGEGAPMFIAGGQTSRSTPHACIYQGKKLIHDPHPSRAETHPPGLVEIEDMTFLVPIKFDYRKAGRMDLASRRAAIYSSKICHILLLEEL